MAKKPPPPLVVIPMIDSDIMGRRYMAGAERHGDRNACPLCGKKTVGSSNMVHLVNGGTAIAPADGTGAPFVGDMGWWRICNTTLACRNKIPVTHLRTAVR